MTGCEACHATPEPLCADCHTTTSRTLAAWPRMYVELTMALAPTSDPLAERVASTGPRSRAPVAEDVLNVLTGAQAEVTRWETTTRDFLGLPHPAKRRAAVAFAAGCSWLAARLDNAATAGPQHAHALNKLHNRARDVLGHSPLVHRLDAPCPSCDVRALIRHNGADHITCAVCGTRWTEAHYRLLVAAIVHDQKDPA